jgi:glutaredoxin
MRKHETSTLKYVLVFGFTVIIFLFGVLLGNYFTERKFESINGIEETLRTQTQGAELQYLLLIQEPCRQVNSTPLADELYRISERLDYMESQRGENDADVQQLKNTYSLLELRHWLLVLKTNEQCKTNQVPVLFFYSNSGDCPKCKEQGYTLTYLRKKYPDLRIYSFDTRTQNPALDTVKRMHDVTDAPVIILPDRRLGFTSLDDMEAILVNDYHLNATS